MRIHPEPAALIALTPFWTGPRFASGRPRVPHEVLNRLRVATTEQAWDVLRAEGYPRQFAGGWLQTHCRGTDPTAILDVTLAGINLPVRVGQATVLPGDIVLGTPTGVTFIPAQLAGKVADVAEDIAVRDIFGKARLAEQVYGSADIDTSPWAPDIENDFQQWRLARLSS